MNDTPLDNDEGALLANDALALGPLDDVTPVTAAATAPDLRFFGKIPVNVTLEVASVEVALNELLDVDASSVIILDKLAGEPLDVKVNGALFAKAEVVVMNGNYGLRILELAGNPLQGLTA